MDLFQAIIDFHVKFGLDMPEKPRALTDEEFDFRANFLFEEYKEYCDAVAVGDLEGQFDALIDLVYVAIGTAYMQGFEFNEGFRRVHNANMMKERAQRQEDSKRNTTLDVVKPSGWEPASLKDLCE